MIIRSHTTPWQENVARVANEWLFPVALLVGKLLRVDRDSILRSFIAVNNYLVRSKQVNLPGQKVMILAPHCLQHAECPHKITIDVANCKQCGKCKIGELKKQEFELNASINSLNETLQNKKERIAELNHNIEELKAAEFNTKQRNLSFEKDFTELIQKLFSDVNELEDRKAKLRKSILESEIDNTRLEKEIISKRKDLEALKEELLNVREKITELRKNEQIIAQKVQVLNKEENELSQFVTKLKNEIDHKSTIKKNLEKEIESLTKTLNEIILSHAYSTGESFTKPKSQLDKKSLYTVPDNNYDEDLNNDDTILTANYNDKGVTLIIGDNEKVAVEAADSDDFINENSEQEQVNFADVDEEINDELVELVDNIQQLPDENKRIDEVPNIDNFEDSNETEQDIDINIDDFDLSEAIETDEDETIPDNLLDENFEQFNENTNVEDDLLNSINPEEQSNSTDNIPENILGEIENIDLTNDITSDLNVPQTDDLISQLNIDDNLSSKVDDQSGNNQLIDNFDTEINILDTDLNVEQENTQVDLNLESLLEQNVDEKLKQQEEIKEKEKPKEKPKPNLDINIDDEIAKLLNDSINLDD